MSRNIGTSLGGAVFGAVFLHSIDTNLPARLDGVSTQTPAVVAAAEHFVPAGEPSGATHAIAADEIVHGFVLICGAAVVSCVFASGAAFAVRPRVQEAAIEAVPVAIAAKRDAAG